MWKTLKWPSFEISWRQYEVMMWKVENAYFVLYITAKIISRYESMQIVDILPLVYKRTAMARTVWAAHSILPSHLTSISFPLSYIHRYHLYTYLFLHYYCCCCCWFFFFIFLLREKLCSRGFYGAPSFLGSSFDCKSVGRSRVTRLYPRKVLFDERSSSL